MTKEALPADLEKMAIWLDSLRTAPTKGTKLTNISHKEEKVDPFKLFPYEPREILQQFLQNRRVVTRITFKSWLGLAHLVEFFRNKIIEISPAKKTKFTIMGREAELECDEIFEQLGPRLTVDDRVKFATDEGGVITTFSHKGNDKMYFKLKTSYVGKLENPTLKAIVNIQNDSRLFATLKKIESFDDATLQYLFPEITNYKPRRYADRRHWRIFNPSNDKTHARILQHVTQYYFPVPYVIQGIVGAGKSSLLSHLIITLLKNDPLGKIVITSKNNIAIDSLLKKVLEKCANVNIIRYVSDTWGDHLTESLSLPGVKFVDLESALQAYRNKGQILALTADKTLKLKRFTGVVANLILIDEAAMSSEDHLPSVMTGFYKEGKTNTLLAGDVYQTGNLVLSDEAKILNMNVSMMERLVDTNLLYRKDKADRMKIPPIAYLTVTYRLPREIMRLIKPFYPFEIFAIPDEAKSGRFINLVNMPKGHVIYHSIVGVQAGYSNNARSISNSAEAAAILTYLKVLILQNQVAAKEIMIIPFYSKQNFEITKAANEMGFDIKESESTDSILNVGPIRAQGLERPIVLLSLVQSQRKVMGQFLKDDAKILVALSRSSSLLIILADEALLKQYEGWERVLKYKIPQNKIGKDYLKLDQDWENKYIHM